MTKVSSLVVREYNEEKDRIHLWLLSTNVLGKRECVLECDGNPVDLGCGMNDLKLDRAFGGIVEERAKRALTTMAAMDAVYP